MEGPTVVRDDWGVPHITAASEAAAAYAVGWTQAEDALPWLLERYAAASGTLTSVRGEAEQVRLLDVAARRWRHLEESREGFTRLAAPTQALLTAYTRGLADWCRAHPDVVPEWAPTLEPALPIALTRSLLWFYAISHAAQKIRAEGVSLAADVDAIVEAPLTPQPSGSNQWAVAGWRTADGAPALLSDPHGDIDGLRMWEAVVSVEGCYRWVGVCIAGSPLPILGHNEDVAWGLTTGSPDVSDAYRVPLTHEPEVVLNGVRAPIVASKDDSAYAIATPYMHCPELYVAQQHAQLSARSCADIVEAAYPMGHFPQNLLAADRHGGMVYLRLGRTPRRAAGVDWSRVLDGTSPAERWQGIHSLEDLVQCSDPPIGFLQNCNVAPETMLPSTAGTSLDPAGYPPYLYFDEPGRTNTRGRRLVPLLEALDGAATWEDLLAIALDEQLPDVDRWQAALARSLERNGPPDGTDDLLVLVHAFEGDLGPASTTAGAYLAWREAMAGRCAKEDPRRVKDLFDHVLAGRAHDPGDDALLLDPLAVARDTLVETFGRLDTPLGEAYRIGRGAVDLPGRSGALSARQPLSTNDARSCTEAPLRLMMYGPPDDNGVRRAVLGGRSLRLVQFTKPIRSASVVLFGQSGDPDSPHHADQCALFSNAEVRSTYFDDDELAAHAVSQHELVYDPDERAGADQPG